MKKKRGKKTGGIKKEEGGRRGTRGRKGEGKGGREVGSKNQKKMS